MQIALIDLDFLLSSAQSCQKPFWSFKGHNSGREHRNYRNGSNFLSTFLRIPVCNIHFWIWNSLSCGAPFGPFCSVKYHNFSPNATYLGSLLYFSRKTILWGYQKSILCFVQPPEPNTYLFRLQLMDYKVNIFNSVIDGNTTKKQDEWCRV